VLVAVERGIPRREVAQLFGVSLATIGRYIKRRAEDGQIAPKPSPGRKPKVLDTPEHKGILWDQLRENETATLEEHCRMWEESQGVRVSVATMSAAYASWVGVSKKIDGILRARRAQKKCL
jgi:transposase